MQYILVLVQDKNTIRYILSSTTTWGILNIIIALSLHCAMAMATYMCHFGWYVLSWGKLRRELATRWFD